MSIILPGAWPEPEVARDLLPHLEEQAPTLARWLARRDARVTASPPHETWCTAPEHWLLQANGYVPDRHLSAGLGPLRLATEDDDPVWLAELVHMAPSRDGAALLPASTLAITDEQSQGLYDALIPQLDDDAPRLTFVTEDLWRVQWPTPMTLDCASPALVAASSVNDWWPQQAQARPWRRLANTAQMVWFDHPINQQRQQAGLAPVNSLWLYGGARPSQLTQRLAEAPRILDDLQDYALRQDWGGWIGALAQLEQQHLSTLSEPPGLIVLTGRERYVELPPTRAWWRRWRRHPWRTWWCSR